MNPKIEIQNLLPDSKFVCFVIPSLLNKAECENLLAGEIKNSFQGAHSNYPTHYRNNERLVIDDATLANSLFEKVEPYLPARIEIISSIISENGSWTLTELNSRLRFCKYSANQYFNRHLDGVYYRSDTQQSKLTFMIYLNGADEFEGGRTLFYKTKEDAKIWASYIPRQGDLIVFDHNVWHEGEVLRSGEKFVLRSDILYSKDSPVRIYGAFSGHLGYIWKLLKFDDETILSGGRDKIINIWNKKGEWIESLPGHHNSILCMEKMSENIFLTGSRDRRILCWKKRSDGKFEQWKFFEHHSALVLALCRLSETTFISSGGDNIIKMCNLSDEIEREFAGHSNWVWQLIKLPGDFFASCSEDHTIKIWNSGRTECLQTFHDHCPVISLLYDQQANRLISGNLDGEITIIELSRDFENVSTRKIKAHTGLIRTLVKLNEHFIASGAEDNKVKIWNVSSGQCVSEISHENFVQSLEQIDENTFLSASYDGTIKSWNVPASPDFRIRD